MQKDSFLSFSERIYFYFFGLLNLWLGHIEKRYRDVNLGVGVSIGRTLSGAMLPVMYLFLGYIGKLEFNTVLFLSGSILPLGIFLRALQGSQFASVNIYCRKGSVARKILWLNMIFGCIEAMALVLVFLICIAKLLFDSEFNLVNGAFISASIASCVVCLNLLVRLRLRIVNMRIVKQLVGLYLNVSQVFLAMFMAVNPSMGYFGIFSVLLLIGAVYRTIVKAEPIPLLSGPACYDKKSFPLISIILGQSKLLLHQDQAGRSLTKAENLNFGLTEKEYIAHFYIGRTFYEEKVKLFRRSFNV